MLRLGFALAMIALCSGHAMAKEKSLQFETEGPTVEKARGLLKDLFHQDIDDAMHVAALDVNRDGLNDLLVFAETGYMCGSACTPKLFINRGFSWDEIRIDTGAVTGNWENWFLSSEVMNDWTVLVGEEQAAPAVYGWDGASHFSRIR